jgi:Raf kinase inhibitor-like YbhB/YbcL family protein
MIGRMHRAAACAWLLTFAAALPGAAQTAPVKLVVESATVKSMQTIPADHTADGKNTSPALTWSGAPAATREFALIMDDPDAPTPQPFVHWVIYKIPATAKGLPEAIPAGPTVSVAGLTGAYQGPTGFSMFRRQGSPPPEPGYRGPAPPPGKPHRYTFTLFALDAPLDVEEGLDKAGLLKAMEGHIVGQGQLIGLYERTAPATPAR